MKRKRLIQFALLVALIVAFIVVWLVGFLQGHVRMNSLNQYSTLGITTRAYNALVTNDVVRAKWEMEKIILFSSRILAGSMDHPVKTLVRSGDLSRGIAGPTAFTNALARADAVKNSTAFGWTKNENGSWSHPPLAERKSREETAQPERPRDF